MTFFAVFINMYYINYFGNAFHNTKLAKLMVSNIVPYNKLKQQHQHKPKNSGRENNANNTINYSIETSLKFIMRTKLIKFLGS